MTDHSRKAGGVLDCDQLLAALDTPALIVDGAGVILQVNNAVRSLCTSNGGHMRSGAPLVQAMPELDEYWPSGSESFDTGCGVECLDLDSLVRVRGAPLCDSQGIPAGWLILLQEQDAAERRSTQRLRSLLESMDDLVLIIDPNGRIVEYYEPEGENLTSDSGRMLGRFYQDVLPETAAHKFTDMMARVRETGRTHRFDHLLVLDGMERWYSANIGPLRNEEQGMSGYLVVARNITERKLIETAEREQRVLAEALQDVALALNSTLHLEEIWKRILSNVVRVVPADAAAIMLVEGGIARVVGERGYSERGLMDLGTGHEIEVESLGRLQYMTRTCRPCLIPDARAYGNWLRLGPAEDEAGPANRGTNWARSYLGAPILLDEEVIGFLMLESAATNYFTPKDAERLRSFADHAASAIRNARLYAQAQELAAVQERQRLARDLHDAVSQMLFSAKIIAEMLPRLRDRDPDSVWEYLPELQRLIQGAMGEMRILLLELRPAILTDVDLSVLVGYLVDVARARTSARISLEAEEVCPLPEEVQIGLYRIAQEALSNAIKHAHAKTIDVAVRCAADEVSVRIGDDGAGFDETAVRPENLGLGIMRERADEIGADLRIESVKGGGTSVEVRWKTAGAGG